VDNEEIAAKVKEGTILKITDNSNDKYSVMLVKEIFEADTEKFNSYHIHFRYEEIFTNETLGEYELCEAVISKQEAHWTWELIAE